MSESERPLRYGVDYHLGDFVPPHGGVALADFLLARIVEDEAFWTREVNDLVMGGIAERMLAECEAKRRIIFDAQQREASLRSRRGPAPAAVYGHVMATRRVLRQLAAVYAEHPDYREEWRP